MNGNVQNEMQFVGDAVIAVDTEGGVMWMNPLAEWLTGCSGDVFCGKPLSELIMFIDQSTRERIQVPLAQALNPDTVCNVLEHTLLVTGDGIEYPVFGSISSLRQPGGCVQGSVLVFRNVAELHQQDLPCIQAHQMEALGMFARRLVHDLNNVLTGILGPISIMDSMLETDTAVSTEQLLKYLNIMRRSCERAMKMRESLQTLSNHISPNGVPEELNQSLKHVVDMAMDSVDRT